MVEKANLGRIGIFGNLIRLATHRTPAESVESRVERHSLAYWAQSLCSGGEFVYIFDIKKVLSDNLDGFAVDPLRRYLPLHRSHP
jgi:hypothetical protein